MIYFTSDHHFNHENVIKYDGRPFSSLEEMEEALIEGWNSTVRRGDIVYHVGDFALSYGKKDAARISSIFSRLNGGEKHLIRGNHDRKEVYNLKWTSVDFYKEVKVDLGGIHKQRIILSHYAMRVWNQMHRGSWMLYGHSHGSLSDIGGLTTDIGVKCWNYLPVSLDQIILFMENRTPVYYDHHVAP